jgi:hypothetical protein
MEGVAAGDAFEGQQRPTKHAMTLDGLNSVCRTRRFVSAHFELAHGPENDLVRPDADDENLLH